MSKLYFLCLLCQISLIVSGQKPVHDLLANAAIKGSVVGIQIVDLETGKPVLSHNSETLMMPASTQKLLFTLAAIDQLGADHVFRTGLYISGKIDGSGTLKGDFIVSSEGDPSFASDRNNPKMSVDLIFQTIFKTLTKLGIKKIDGNLVLLMPGFPDPAAGSWNWEDLSNYYGSGSWGFNFMENEYSIFFRRQPKPGQLCPIERIEPEIPGLKLTSQVFAAGANSGDQAYVMGSPSEFTKKIVGTIPSGKGLFRIKGSIPNPPATFLRMLKVFLDKKGIRSNGMKLRYGHPSGERLVGKFSSKPLKELARDCNFYSINLYAEAFGKAMLDSRNIEVLSGYPKPEHWGRLFAGYPGGTEDMNIRDACGLSFGNLISPSKLTQYLVTFNKKLGMNQLKYLLPRAGSEGTVKKFMENQKTGQQVWLKSGSIEGVWNYAGIFKSPANGKHYAFALMVNHCTQPASMVQKALEQFLVKAMNLPFD